MKEWSDLPSDTEVLVDFLRLKEAIDILLEGFLELGFENDIVPVALLDLAPQGMALLPPSLVVDPDFVVQLLLPSSAGEKEEASGILGSCMCPVDEFWALAGDMVMAHLRGG